MNMQKIAIAIALATGLGFAGHAKAADDTADFKVKIKITAACKIVSATDVDFGSQPSTKTTNSDATGTITVNCTKDSAYTVGLNAGTSGGTVTSRKMSPTSGGSDKVPYALYRDASRSQNWGTASGDRVSGTGNGANQTITVYGRVAGADHSVKNGDYEDTVTATIYL